MYAVGKLSSYITQGVYTVSAPFHPFGGAVDIIVVQQEDGSFKSSPWYVRFGKFQGVLKTREKVVNISVNGVGAEFHMYLDHKGEAYFLKDCDSDEGGDFLISPPSSGDEMEEKLRSIRFTKSQSCNYDTEPGPIVSMDNVNTKIIARTSSRRSRILGLMFGRNSMKGSDKGGNVERENSMERAEIAADLLETKWSTNIQGSNYRGDNHVERTNSDVTNAVTEIVGSCNEGTDNNFNATILGRNFNATILSREQVDEVEIHNPSVVYTSNIGEAPNSCTSNDEFSKEVVDSQDEKLDNNPKHEIVRQVHFEEIITHTSSSEIGEELLEVYTLEAGDFGESKVISDSAASLSDEYNTSSQETVLNNFIFDTQSGGSMELLDGVIGASEEKDNREGEVSSFSHTETTESISCSSDVSMQTQANVNLSLGGDGSMQQCTGNSYETNEHTCEETPTTLEPDEAVDEESYLACRDQDLELHSVGDSSVIEDSEAHSPSKVAFDMMKDACSAGIPQNSSLSESEAVDAEGEAGGISQEKLSRIGGVDVVVNRCQMSEVSSPQSNYHVPVHNATNFVPSDRDQENVEEAPLLNRFTNSQCESRYSEDEQFLFSDIDSFSVKEIKHEEPISNIVLEVDDPEEHESEDTNHDECFESVSEVSGTQTGPLAVPSNKSLLEQTECFDGLVAADYWTKSLPVIRSQIHDLERSDLCHQLSCSLDFSSDNYDQNLPKMDVSSSLKSETGSEGNRIHYSCMSEAADTADGSENNCADKVPSGQAAVELSLCKHLLFEAMGADAAARVFNSEKVNVEKFSTLGSSIVKNDKLVVRIEGRYFPWDAAAPIILGMLCFGQENKFEPQGMIAVDREEKNFGGDPSGAIVPSGGSWRLWPFSLKKSKALSTVISAPENTNQENVKAVPARSQSMMGHDDMQRVKFAKKQVRALTPSSQQLASLNLKEGRNVITFNFSTAMLGQQQVDARIYLWKWNTRIVISDVDGTITKSDVLGQFMPLVGKDWSQTGVTHLFSAIKENGYQFLFLSARAISQAYLTRQFLFNLKQDGKSLPDGPVVISPDGLFPSLYREVIRRAPHEFKISCLEDIKALFPPECNPFYAGFGNRDTDEFSYLRVGIPKGKIFIINPKGEVAVNRRVDTKSYTSLHALVHGMFPPMFTAEQEDFNSWNYWKLPLPDIDV